MPSKNPNYKIPTEMTATREKRMAGSFYYASLWRSRNGMVEPENDIPNPLYPQDPCPIPFPTVFSARSLEDPGDSKRRPDPALSLWTRGPNTASGEGEMLIIPPHPHPPPSRNPASAERLEHLRQEGPMS